MGRTWTAAIAVLGMLLGCSPAQGPGPAKPPAHEVPDVSTEPPAGGPARLAVGRSAWVRVSVATVWRDPSRVRSVDAPAVARPARIRRWLDGMTLDERRDLVGRADTQALLGDRVQVVGFRDTWARVRVAGQPNPGDVGGYDGWVPRRQLTARAPVRTDTVVTVVSRTAWLRADDSQARRVMEISYGTRLFSGGTVGRFVRVLLPGGGGSRRVLARDVLVHDRGSPALPSSRASVASSARSFVGLDYLWAGRSGFGLDCSGLTSLVYRVHGIVIPRDAAPQSQAGTFVSRDTWLRGDLIFYATDGSVHHVAMYVGQGSVAHAPRTGRTVEVVPVISTGYWTARRYLD